MAQAYNFAQQRPVRGMAGFKFRTRTKSKYDPPQVKNFLESIQQQLDANLAKRRGKSACQKATDRQLITSEDVKNFFEQLKENTGSVQKSGHKLALNEVIDFQEDLLRVQLATQNVQDALEVLAEQRLQQLVEGMLEAKEIDVSDMEKNRNLSTQGRKENPVTTQHSEANITNHNSSFVSTLPKATINMINRKTSSAVPIESPSPQKIEQPAIIKNGTGQIRQQLRLSAEGLLDIVTEQYVDGKMSASIINKNQSGVNAGTIPKELSIAIAEADSLQNAQELASSGKNLDRFKVTALLTPILTEASQGGNSSYLKKQHDNNSGDACLGSVNKQIEVHSAEVRLNDDSVVSLRKPEDKCKIESIPSQQHLDLQKMLDPVNIQTTRQQGLTKQLTQKSQKSNQSKQTTVQSPLRLRPDRKGTLSQDNLRSTITPRQMEPRCDNDDLRMVSDNAKEEQNQNEFGSKLANKQDQTDQCSNEMHRVENSNSNVGLIELKLTHHASRNRSTSNLHSEGQQKQQRLRSAGANQGRKSAATKEAEKSSLSVNRGKTQQVKGQTQNGLTRHYSGAHIKKSSAAQAPNFLNSEPDNNSQINLRDEGKRLASEESWVQNIYYTKAEGKEQNKRFSQKHHTGTLFLSDKSQGTAELAKDRASCHQEGQQPVDQFAPVEIDNSTVSVAHLPKNQPSTITGPSESQILRQKEHLQQMLEQEIERIRDQNTGVSGSTPQLAFLDPSQLAAIGYNKSPKEALQYFEDTMKEHFKYGMSDGALQLGRPILSTRQTYSIQLQQKVLEAKILDTLRSSNQKQKFDEFQNAQQFAAAMMDIVTTSQEQDIIGIPISLNRETALNELNTTLKIGSADEKDDAITSDLRTPGYSIQKSPFRSKRVTIEVAKYDQTANQTQNISPDLQCIDHANKFSHEKQTMTQNTSQKHYQLPNQLDLVEQENVTQILAQNSQKIGESRKTVDKRRESRPDTLNYLASPKEPFEMSLTGFKVVSQKELLLSATIDEVTRNQHEFQVAAQTDGNMHPSPTKAITRVKSANQIGQRVAMKTQGGGFNRTQNSGYFKVRQIVDERRMSHVPVLKDNVQQSTTTAGGVKHAYVEERPQILANEVWADQNRGMPFKVMLHMQKPPLKPQTLTPKSNQSPSQLNFSQQREQHEASSEAKFEIYPQRKETLGSVKLTSMTMMTDQKLRTENVSPPQEVVVVIPSDQSQAQRSSAELKKNTFTRISSVNQMQLYSDREGPSLAAVNEQFSEGQQTASNNVIVEHRYSKQSKTKLADSTVQLRASSQMFCNPDSSSVAKLNQFSNPKLNLVNSENLLVARQRPQNNRSSQELAKHRQELMASSYDANLQKLSDVALIQSQKVEPKDLMQKNPYSKEEKTFLVSSEPDNKSPVISEGDEIQMDKNSSANNPSFKESSYKDAQDTKVAPQEPDSTDLKSVKEKSETQHKTGKSETVDQSRVSQVILSPTSSQVNTDRLEFDAQNEEVQQPRDDSKLATYQIVEVKPEQEQTFEQVDHQDKELQSFQNRRRSVLNKATTSRGNTPDGAQTSVHVASQPNSNADLSSHLGTEYFRAQLAPKQLVSDQVLVQDEGEQFDHNTFQALKDEKNEHAKYVTNPTQDCLKTDPASMDESKISNQKASRDLILYPVSKVEQQHNKTQAVTPKHNLNFSSSEMGNARQVIYKNGKLIHAQQPMSRTQRHSVNVTNRQARGRNQSNASTKKFTQQKALNSDLANTMSGKSFAPPNQSKTQIQQMSSKNVSGTGFKKPPVLPKDVGKRLTFSQGVQQLIKNFDKKFIGQHQSMSKSSIKNPLQTQQIQISERQSLRISVGAKDATIQSSKAEKDTDQYPTNQPLSGIQTLTQGGSSPPGSPKDKEHVQNSPILTHDQKHQLARSKSRPTYGANHKHILHQNQQKSPVQTKEFKATGLSLVHNSTMYTPNAAAQMFAKTTAMVSPMSTNTEMMNPQPMHMQARSSMNSQTTLATMQKQRKRLQQGYQRGAKSSTSRAQMPPMMSKRAIGSHHDQRQHPLEFLASVAIKSSKDEIESRNDGLLINERKRFHDQADYALSEQVQDIVQSLNSSRINQDEQTFRRLAQKQVADIPIDQGDQQQYLLDKRRHQRQNRQQQVVFGSQTIKSFNVSMNQQQILAQQHEYQQQLLPEANKDLLVPIQNIMQGVRKLSSGDTEAAQNWPEKVQRPKFMNQRPASVPRKQIMKEPIRTGSVDSTHHDDVATTNYVQQAMAVPSMATSTHTIQPAHQLEQSQSAAAVGQNRRPNLRGMMQQNQQFMTQKRFYQGPIQQLDQFGQPKNQVTESRNKLNLTHNDITVLCKDLSRQDKLKMNQTQNLVKGKSFAGNKTNLASKNIIGRRRVQSSNTNKRPTQTTASRKFPQANTLSKRSSLLFNQTAPSQANVVV